MTVEQLDINGISNLTGLLQRLPLGEQARGLLQRIGVWNTRAHDGAPGRLRAFDPNVSELPDDALSNSFGFWNSELIRIHELCGLLDGQRKLLELSAKKARAQARSKIRSEYEDRVRAAKEAGDGEKVAKPTAGEINDRAEDDESVTTADAALVMLDVVLAGVHAYREGCLTAVSGLSREISFRQAQFTARVRA